MMLPVRPRRAWLISFWIVFTGAVTGTVTAMSVVMGRIPEVLIVVVVGVASLVFGTLSPSAVKPVYRLWNWVSELVLRGVRLTLKLVCFFLLFTVVGRGGAALPLIRQSGASSFWLPRHMTTGRLFRHEYEAARGEAASMGWVRTFLAWAWESGHGWALAVLPFLVLLATLEPEAEQEFPSNIYTLF